MQTIEFRAIKEIKHIKFIVKIKLFAIPIHSVDRY